MSDCRNKGIDFLKGLSIIAVFLYHALGEYFPYGYLGVDVFLVIAGYFMIQHFAGMDDWNTVSCWNYIYGRLIRIYPLVFALCVVGLLIGYFVMLPDDYENLGDSVVATSVFANNFLSAITVHDYWRVDNLYRPLMHTWYLGILFQLYLFVVVALYAANRLFVHINKEKLLRYVCVGLGLISLVIFLLPSISFNHKFYYPQFRIFEFVLGGGGTFIYREELRRFCRVSIGKISLIILSGLLLCGYFCHGYLNPCVLVLIAVSLTCYLLLCMEKQQISPDISVVHHIGAMSLSVYIWHQLIIAFARYSVTDEFGWVSLASLTIAVVFAGWLSYVYVEQGLCRWMKQQNSLPVCAGNIFCGLGVFAAGLVLFFRAGVVREVPELGITMNNFKRGMHAVYCDRIYSYDKEFSDDTSKKKIFIIGNSFGRDWANVLLESIYAEKVGISYLFPHSRKDYKRCKERFDKADRIFYALGPGYNDVSEEAKKYLPSDKFYIIGNKWYGKSNGLIYGRRFIDNYFAQRIRVPMELKLSNVEYKEKYKEKFIDMMDLVLDEGDKVKVFTDDNMFISQDCRHFTQAGARFYARRLDIRKYVGM